MTLAIYVDPGKHATGLALFESSRLISCSLLRSRTLAEAVSHDLKDCSLISKVVVELPQIYARSRSKADPNDLIEIAAVAGAMARAFAPAVPFFIRPAKWKAQVPKEVIAARARAELSEGELARALALLEPIPKSLRHNVWDAIAIGLHDKRRLR